MSNAPKTILSASLSAGGTVAAIPAVPWTQIIGAGIAVTGAGVAGVVALFERREKLLSGDQAAIAGWAKRAAKWPASKRKKTAEKLLKKYKELKAKGSKRILGKEREDYKNYQANLKELELKLAALYQIEARARKAPTKPVVPDDPATTPIYANTQPDTPDEGEGLPILAVLLAALVTGGAVWLATREDTP